MKRQKTFKIFTAALLSLAIVGLMINYFIHDSRDNDVSDHYDTRVQNETEANPDATDHIFRMIRLDAKGEYVEYPAGHVYSEFRKAHDNFNIKLPSIASGIENPEEELDWVERGPGNVGGRTRVLLVDVADRSNETWLVGAAGGGIWRTVDSGLSWNNVSPNVPNLAVVTMAQSQSDPNILYAGTGEGAFNGSSGNGSGILKSIDGGNSWSLLESTTGDASQNFYNTNRIIVNPLDENEVIAVTSNGAFGQEFRSAVLKSTDGGLNWSVLYEPLSRAQQIVADPDDFNVLYLSLILRGVEKSTDGGITWNDTGLVDVVGSTLIERTELAIAPNNSDRIYASVSYINRSGSGLFTSPDGGDTWFKVEEADGSTSDIDFLIQGEYDNCIVVDPFNSNIVFWGGVELWKSTLIEGDVRQGDRDFLSVNQVGTETFLDFVNFNNGTHFGNRLSISNPDQVPSLEIRFGPGRSQKAHRFTVPNGGNAGVPAAQYTYRDYVDVPFEVWDVEANRQLMVSFRDQQNDGVFNLNLRGQDEEESTNREYIYINNLDYNAGSASPSIAISGGHEFNELLFMWPTLPEGGTWNPNDLPESVLKINFGNRVFQNTVIENIASNGGQNANKVHVDHHFLTTIPLSGNTYRLITCNDGGVDYSDDLGATFVAADRGLGITQFYAALKKPNEPTYIGGTQDNEVLMSIDNAGAQSFYTPESTGIFADGFQVAWNHKRPTEILASNQRNVIFFTDDGGFNWTSSVTGLEDSGFSNESAPFFTKIGYSPNGEDAVFAVSQSGVWRSLSFGRQWALISLTAAQGWGGFLDVEVSDADPSVVWAGGGMSDTRNLFVSEDQGLTFRPVNDFADLGNITAIIPNPNDRNSCFVTFSQFNQTRVIRTDDLGETWVDLSGYNGNESSDNGFPNVATFSLLPFPDGETIWVGTEIGLFISTDNGASWQADQSSLPKVLIWDFEVVDGEVIVATHGRGIWTVDLGLEYPGQLVITSTDEQSFFEGNITVYPNPATSDLNFRGSIFNDGREFKLKLSKLDGSTASSYTVKGKNPSINVSHLTRGLYLVEILDNNKTIGVSKVVLQ